MTPSPEELRKVPLFALLDEDELTVLSRQVELKTFEPRQRIYKIGDTGGRGYLVTTGLVCVKTVDADQQEVIVDEPGPGDVFGFASMLDRMPHQTEAEAKVRSTCIEIDHEDILRMLETKPHSGMDLLVVLSRQIHAAHDLVRQRAVRNPNEVIEEESTLGERVADSVAQFGGSWFFILTFALVLSVYVLLNEVLGRKAWDPYPFILLNLFLSMLAAIQAPVIMMSQNRQDKKDRVRSEMDFDVNKRAEMEIQGLANKLNSISEKIGDLDDAIRKQTKTL